jgi:ATP-binding cassette subfamily C protein
MRLLITFARTYPLHSAIMLFALLLAGIAEGFGFSALLPLLNAAVRSRAGAGQIPSGPGAEPGSPAEEMVEEALLAIGLNPTVEVLLVVIVLAIFLKSGLVLLANRRVGYTVSQVATDLRLSLLRALLLTRWEYHVRQPVGGMVNAMATEAKRSSKACLSCVTMVSLVIQTAVYVGVALLVSWKATFFCLSAGLALMYLLSRPVKRARRAGKRQTKLLKSLLGHMTDILQSIKPLKTMAREKSARTIMVRRTKLLNKALRKQIFSKELLRAYQESVRAVLIAIGLYVALVHWNLPLTTTMVLTVLLVRILMQLGKVQQEYQQMVIFESAYDSIRETISEAEAEKEVVSGSLAPTLKKAIRLDRVSFSYSKAPVLRNVSLSFPAGQITTIVGPSGSGKTTVADLLTGLLRPTQGEIWIDDVPMSEVDLRCWRSMIGYVPQDTLLLHDTVLVNVTLGDPGLSHDDGERALRAAGAWDFVKAMPQGMHSIVGERGGKLSGGQQQRIAIARALVHEPTLLILDEATSALDSESEAAICDTLQKLRGKITTLAISHRDSLVRVADRAYRLEEGRVERIE